MTPRPVTAATTTLIAVLMSVGALTTALDVANQGTLTWVVWIVCMTPPVLVLPILAAHAAQRGQRLAAGRRELARLEGLQPLAGRTGRLARDRADGEYPLPPERRVWWFEDGTLRLAVVGRPEGTRVGDEVRILRARPLAVGDVPFVEAGVGVEVEPADG